MLQAFFSVLIKAGFEYFLNEPLRRALPATQKNKRSQEPEVRRQNNTKT
jgi:hypothetical protein